MQLRPLAAMVLALAGVMTQASVEGKPEAKLDYNQETYVGALPISVECFFAAIFVLLIASVPLLLAKLKKGILTKAHICESVLLIIWLSTTLFLFTNVLKFGSGHWEGIRPLTLVEAVYVLAQVLTTVGYGDITPALPRGQVWVAINVLIALCLYGSIIMEVTELVQERLADYFEEQDRARREIEQRAALQGDAITASGHQFVACDGAAAPLCNWKREVNVNYGPLLKSSCAFLTFATIGVLFWHYYPGEEKTWLQAIYMSIITLSTVGFGWFNATTEGGKVFGAFWMMFGVASLAATLTNFVELMFKLKEAERVNEDSEKLNFFRLRATCCTARNQEGVPSPRGGGRLEERSMDRYEFLKFGLLLKKQCTEEEIMAIEKRFAALGPNKDGLLTRKVIEENEAPPVEKEADA